MRGKTTWIVSIAVTLGMFLLPGTDSGKRQEAIAGMSVPVPELILPHFEVGLEPDQANTVFTVNNAWSNRLTLNISVYTGWAIPLFTRETALEPYESITINLREWLVNGDGFDPPLTPSELLQFQAALAGIKAPDGLYYSTPVAENVMTGFIVITASAPSFSGVQNPACSIWGNYSLLDAKLHRFRTLRLAVRNVGGVTDFCIRHGVEYRQDEISDDGTLLYFWNWNSQNGAPSETEYPPQTDLLRYDVYDDLGQCQKSDVLPVYPTTFIRVKDLNLDSKRGRLDFAADTRAFFITASYGNLQNDRSMVNSWCLPCGSMKTPTPTPTPQETPTPTPTPRETPTPTPTPRETPTPTPTPRETPTPTPTPTKTPTPTPTATPTPQSAGGCTLGYWKNHLSSWNATGYSPSQSISGVFPEVSLYPSLSSTSLLGALSFHGGSGVDGGAQILLKQAVAALLNSRYPGMRYQYSTGSIIGKTNKALASQNRDTMVSLGSLFDSANNSGCPLN